MLIADVECETTSFAACALAISLNPWNSLQTNSIVFYHLPVQICAISYKVFHGWNQSTQADEAG